MNLRCVSLSTGTKLFLCFKCPVDIIQKRVAFKPILDKQWFVMYFTLIHGKYKIKTTF